MEIQGSVKHIHKTKTFGANGFRKRELLITTDEQYPQHILIEFIQDKCELLDQYKVGQEVKISINIRGKEWMSPEGVVKYFNSIQGWRIGRIESSKMNDTPLPDPKAIDLVDFDTDDDSELPF